MTIITSRIANNIANLVLLVLCASFLYSILINSIEFKNLYCYLILINSIEFKNLYWLSILITKYFYNKLFNEQTT
jgi:hypothetical protein